MASNIDPDLVENIRKVTQKIIFLFIIVLYYFKIKNLQDKQLKLEAEFDEYLALAHQVIVERDLDKAVELLLKAKRVYIDLNETVEKLRKTKDDIGYHD